jgi:Pvc16 N-terminal domain/IPT/TIG domain
MSASTAIGMVSASLRNLLAGEMRLSPGVDVTVLAPDEPGGNRRVNLFLYKLEENPFLRNQEPTVRPGVPNQLVPAPLSLNLFYLLTPYAPNDPQTGNATAHQILGEAMRVLYEHPVVPRDHLDAGLRDARERLQVGQCTLNTEELSNLWTTFSQPFRLSVLYQVSTVQLDRLAAAQRPLPNRVRRVAVPQVRQPLAPPAILEMTPTSGPVGTPVTFSGSNLTGWTGSVLIGGTAVLEGQALTDEPFTVTIPGDLLPGFYDVQVDISRLFRRVFLFEVTP